MVDYNLCFIKQHVFFGEICFPFLCLVINWNVGNEQKTSCHTQNITILKFVFKFSSDSQKDIQTVLAETGWRVASIFSRTGA